MTGRETQRMRYFMNRLVWIVCVFATIAVCVSCGKAKEAATKAAVEKAIETQAAADGKKVDVDLSGDKMTVKTDDGTTKIDGNSMEMTSNNGRVRMVSGEGATIPAGFPKDVPLYPGAKVTLAATDSGEKSTTITLQSKDAVDVISAFMTKEMTAQGWKEDMVIKQPGDQPMHMLGYKKDNRTLMCTIAGGGDGANISMTLQTEEPPAQEASTPAPAPEEQPAEEPKQPQ